MINLTELSFGYTKNQQLFLQLNMELLPGKIYGLFGMNGAGKTTLLKHIAGLLFPQSGTCELLGKPAQARLPEILANTYLIPEEFELPPISGRSFVALHAPFYPRFDQRLLTKYLGEFEMPEDKKLTTLSYGQKKKFLIAFGLATGTSILLMDEPTNGLDIPSKSQFRRILAMAASEDQCILISTHQVRDLANTIDHIIILDTGKIIFTQSLSAISDKLAFVKIKEDSQETVLYQEEILGGASAIVPNKGQETAPDLELLFNAVVREPEKIQQAF